MSIMSDSNKREAERLASKLLILEENESDNYNYKENIKNKLINLMVVNGESKVGRAKLVKKKLLKPMEVSELLTCFNTNELADFVVVTVDVKATRENIKFKLGKNDDYVDKLLAILYNKSINEVYDVEVMAK